VLELESVTSSVSKIFEANYHSSSSCVFCNDPFTSGAQRMFCMPPDCTSNDTKNHPIWLRNEEKFVKCWVMVSSTLLLWHNISLYHILLNFNKEVIHFWHFLSVKLPIVCIESSILKLMRCWTTHIWGKKILKRNPTSTCKFPTFTRTNPFLITFC
jgi:hypothetical protein